MVAASNTDGCNPYQVCNIGTAYLTDPFLSHLLRQADQAFQVSQWGHGQNDATCARKCMSKQIKIAVNGNIKDMSNWRHRAQTCLDNQRPVHEVFCS